MRTISKAVADRRLLTVRATVWTGLATALIVSVAAMSSPAFAQQDGASRFRPLAHTNLPASARKPLSLLSKEHVKVVVIMSTPSVAEARAAVIDHSITPAAHAAIQTQVFLQHAGIEGAITSRGGKILAHYANALNGIKVDIERGEVAGLASLPGVVSVVPVMTHTISNTVSVPYIGAPAVWQGVPELKGQHIKIAIIDTGIDYTHANFGGEGTVAAFTAAAAASTLPADPKFFGPKAPKVKGGIDLAGDDYNGGDPTSVPMPDANPLDCNGHGSHVAGTAAGFGVANDGKRFQGPYNEAAYANGFSIGPGVAPLADLYAVRVFGCSGSTNLVTDGIDWAIANDMDVINMSLGAPFGTAQTADAIAVDNAAKAGVIVAVAAGNNGLAPYIVSTPGSADGAIAAAATDAHASFPGALLGLSGGSTITAQDSNGAPLGGSLPVVVLRDSTGAVSLGCNDSEYVDAQIAGKLVVTMRGVCARIQRAQSGQNHGAAAVAMINSSPGYPPYEGVIAGVTIPFFGVLQTDGPALAGAPSATEASATIANPGFGVVASFSSGGPRSADGALKPEVAAPGVSVISTLVGSGNGNLTDSGTSMATPHVAGVAALVRQAHPSWDSATIRGAIIESASPSAMPDYAPRAEGAGLLQAVGATQTEVTIRPTNGRNGALSFGVNEFMHDYHDTEELIVTNHGSSTATFSVASTPTSGVPHTLRLNRSSLAVGPHSHADIRLTLAVPAATAGSTHDASGNDAFQQVAGHITLTPSDATSNHGVTLQLPYYMVPRARSNVSASRRGNRVPVVRLLNVGGALAGTGDFYALGLRNPPTGAVAGGFEPRAIGVQSDPISATDSVVVFAVNTYGRVSTMAAGEYDIYIDVNGDGVWDYVLFMADIGLVTAGGVANGQAGTFLVNLSTGALTQEFLAEGPTDGSTVLIPVFASDLGITPANPRLTYAVNAFDSSGGSESVPGTASFNVFAPSVANAMFVSVPVNGQVDVPIWVDPVEFAVTPALGFMVVTEDNNSGASQANLLGVSGVH